MFEIQMEKSNEIGFITNLYIWLVKLENLQINIVSSLTTCFFPTWGWDWLGYTPQQMRARIIIHDPALGQEDTIHTQDSTLSQDYPFSVF